MREIKFRILGQDNHWIYFGVYAGKPDVATKPESLGEFTGLNDKNGVEIYEGDILRYKDVGSLLQSGIYDVWYAGGKFVPVADIENPEQDYPDDWDVAHTCEVIGNTYENPELIGGE